MKIMEKFLPQSLKDAAGSMSQETANYLQVTEK